MIMSYVSLPVMLTIFIKVIRWGICCVSPNLFLFLHIIFRSVLHISEVLVPQIHGLVVSCNSFTIKEKNKCGGGGVDP